MIYVLATADACNDYALAHILSLTQTAFNIICIGVPIILIISVIITIIRIITDPDQKHFIRKLVSQFISAIIIFLLPAILDLIMLWLPDGSGSFNITSCWQAAKNASSQVEIGEVDK